MTPNEKLQLIIVASNMGATLNGQPAYITGYRHQFATVKDKTTGLGCEFAWETVERILIRGGKFKS